MTATIRLAAKDDAPAIADIYAPFCEATAVSFEEVAPSPAEMARRILVITERLPWLVLDDAGTVAGYCYAAQHRDRAAYRWSVDTTVYVAPEYRRRGVGRALYVAILPVLTQQGYANAYAGVTLPNPGSVGLHEAVGFKLVGVYRGVGYKLGAWHDVAWYHTALRSERSAPAEPRLLSAVAGSPAWAPAMTAGLREYRPARSSR